MARRRCPGKGSFPFAIRPGCRIVVRIIIASAISWFCFLNHRSDVSGRGFRYIDFGWPLKFSSNEFNISQPTSLPPTPLFGAFEFSTFNLLFDLLVCATLYIVAVRTIAKIRRPALSVRFLLLAVFVTACLFGFLGNAFRQHSADRSFLKRLTHFGWEVGESNDLLPWYVEAFADFGLVDREDWQLMTVCVEGDTEDEIMEALKRSMPDDNFTTQFVSEVDFYGPSITDNIAEAVMAIFTSCHAIQFVDTPAVSESALIRILENSPQVKELTVDGVRLK